MSALQEYKIKKMRNSFILYLGGCIKGIARASIFMLYKKNQHSDTSIGVFIIHFFLFPFFNNNKNRNKNMDRCNGIEWVVKVMILK